MTRSPTTAPARNAGISKGAISDRASLDRIGGRSRKAAATPAQKRADNLGPNDGTESWLHRFTRIQLDLNKNPRVLYLHMGNGLERSGRAMNMLKNMGVRTGAFDWLIVVDGRAHWLELKKPGAKPSDEQLAFMDDARRAGCPAYVADNPLEVRQILYAWAAINIMPDYGEIA